MMKKLIKILYVTLAAILLNSCNEDLLTTIPNDRISTGVFWKTENDAIYAANAVYVYLDNDNAISLFGATSGRTAAMDAFSDIAHWTKSYSSQGLIAKNEANSENNNFHRFWRDLYTGIQRANIFLDNVDKIETTNQQLIERLKGEVVALRAWFYINLAALYGDVPLLTTETFFEESKTLTRTPVSQVWDFVFTELNKAAAVLPITQDETGRITKGAALALKARAMLYAERYTDAAKAAQEVIDLNVYSLYPSYERLFTYAAENNQEVILDRQYIKSTVASDIFRIITPASLWPAKYNEIVPTKNIVDAYQMTNGKDITDPTSDFDPNDPYTNRDPRLKYSIVVLGDTLPNGQVYDSRPNSGTGDAAGSSETSTPTGFNQKKYLNPEDLNDPMDCGINIIIIRYAEVLLTYAEAKIESNQIDVSVLDAINQVRQRSDVDMPPITGITSQAELRKIVRHERMVELAFEGLRYFDIRRWRIAENVIPGPVYGMTYTNQAGDLETLSVPGYIKIFDKTRDYLWPIPQNEIYLNPNLTQNPNW